MSGFVVNKKLTFQDYQWLVSAHAAAAGDATLRKFLKTSVHTATWSFV